MVYTIGCHRAGGQALAKAGKEPPELLQLDRVQRECMGEEASCKHALNFERAVCPFSPAVRLSFGSVATEVVAGREGETSVVWRRVSKDTKGFWWMPRGDVPMKDVPSDETLWGAASAQ